MDDERLIGPLTIGSKFKVYLQVSSILRKGGERTTAVVPRTYAERQGCIVSETHCELHKAMTKVHCTHDVQQRSDAPDVVSDISSGIVRA